MNDKHNISKNLTEPLLHNDVINAYFTKNNDKSDIDEDIEPPVEVTSDEINANVFKLQKEILDKLDKHIEKCSKIDEDIKPPIEVTTADIAATGFTLRKDIQTKMNFHSEIIPKKLSLKPRSEWDTSMIPENVGIDENYLPYIKNKIYGYGKRFNAFCTKNGEHYHNSRCPRYKHSKNKKIIHRYEAIKNNLTPCSICKPRNYIDSWYNEFIKHNSINTSNPITPVIQRPDYRYEYLKNENSKLKNQLLLLVLIIWLVVIIWFFRNL